MVFDSNGDITEKQEAQLLLRMSRSYAVRRCLE